MDSTSRNTDSSRGCVLIIGAGYAELATAIELAKKGFQVEIIESAKELTTKGASKNQPGLRRIIERLTTMK